MPEIPKTVVLGRRSVTTTADLYGHPVPEASGRARDALDNAFRAVSSHPEHIPAAPLLVDTAVRGEP
jgi:hypothetical protein